MKQMIQACSCLLFAIAISYAVFETTNAEQKISNKPLFAQQKQVVPQKQTSLAPALHTDMQVELGG